MKFQACSLWYSFTQLVSYFLKIILITICYIDITTFHQLLGVKAFQYFQSVYQNTFKRQTEESREKKFEIIQPMRLTCMLTASVNYAYLGGFISTRIRI